MSEELSGTNDGDSPRERRVEPLTREQVEMELMQLLERWRSRALDSLDRIEQLDQQLAVMTQERDEAERRGMERAAEAVLQTVIKFDVDWLRTATKAEAIAETLRQASAALRGETGGG